VYSPDDIFMNRYRILSYLDTVDQVQSFRAFDLEQERAVILAILSQSLAITQPTLWQAMQQRFKEETAVAMHLQHPNFISVYDLAQTPEGDIFLVKQDVGGENLAVVIDRDQRLPIEQVLRIGRELCSVLRLVVAQNKSHRVIRPESVIISPDHTWLSELRAPDTAASSTPNPDGKDSFVIPGNPVIDLEISGIRATEQDDIYTLGTLMFRALTGQVFGGQDLRRMELPGATSMMLQRALGQTARDYPSILALERDLTALERQSLLGEVAIVVRHVGTGTLVASFGLLLLVVLVIGLLSVTASLRNLSFANQEGQNSRLIQTSSANLLAWPTSITATLTIAITATPEDGYIDVYEPDDANPAPIAPGDEQKRAFFPENDVDRVMFHVVAGNSYVLQTVDLARNVNTTIEVLAGGKSYTSEATGDGETVRVVFTAVADGTAIAAITNHGSFSRQSTYTLVLLELAHSSSQTPVLEASITSDGRATSTPRPTYTPGSTTTASSTPTSTLTATATTTPTPSTTATMTPSATPSPTATPSATRTPTPTLTEEPSQTPSLTPTLTETPTLTPELTSSPGSRETPTPT
jgi:serine/threonine protein kinase